MNPIITHKFTADPTVLEYDGRVYLFTGHDESPPGSTDYVMRDWLCFSSADLAKWKEHPVPLKAADFKWAKGDAFASKVTHRNGKFYWYAAVSHGTIRGKSIGVAIADSPEGPYRDARGSALIVKDHNIHPDADNFDPAVMIDDDGQAYIFWGKNKCHFAKLRDNMIELDGKINALDFTGFAEGAHIHKRHGFYYFCYGYGMPEKVAYAMAENIHGPWKFQGILNELAGNCETNRPAILDFKGRSYFFYHNGALKDGGSQRRSVCLDYLYYNDDGTMKRVVMSSEGIEAA